MSHTKIEVEPGVRLHIQDVGTGRPVMLLAGFGLDHEVWDGQVCALGVDHRVLGLDLRGTGYSDKPIGDYSMERIAADVCVALDELDISDVTLVGHSFGGQVALLVATHEPQRLRQLVLVSTHGVRASRSPTFPFGPPADAAESALVRGERSRRVATRRSNVEAGFYREPDADLVEWLVRCQLRMPSWAAIPCYRTYLHTDLVAELGELDVPTMQILGMRDPITSIDGASWIQERRTEVELVTIDGCGHYPMFEARECFDAALDSFLRHGSCDGYAMSNTVQ